MGDFNSIMNFYDAGGHSNLSYDPEAFKECLLSLSFIIWVFMGNYTLLKTKYQAKIG